MEGHGGGVDWWGFSGSVGNNGGSERVEPGTVADRFDLDVADVYHALAYYHDHPGEMVELRSAREETEEAVREEIERPPGVESPVE